MKVCSMIVLFGLLAVMTPRSAHDQPQMAAHGEMQTFTALAWNVRF